MIDALTPEQEALLPVYVERYRKIGLDTTPTDRAKAEEAIIRAYHYLNLPTPAFMWFDSPFKGIVQVAKLLYDTDSPTQEQIAEQASSASYGSFEAYWLATYAFIAEVLPAKKDELIDIVKDIAQNVGVYWTFENVVVATDKPIEIHMREEQLHNDSDLAIKYADGSGVYAVDGVRYPNLMAAVVAKEAAKE
jgi:hypothetical protein